MGSVRDIESSVFVRQAQIGNSDLKPAESTNTNFGLIYGNNGNRVSFDYWEIDFENRIEGQSAQALLSEDPFGPSITRNELGDLIGVTTTYFNEESTVLSGIDYGLSTVKSVFNGEVELILQGTNLIEFLTPEQSENGTIMINRVGKHNFDAHTHSLPKNRINTFINYKKNKSKYSLIARYLDGYINIRTISSKALSLGYKNKVDSSLIFSNARNKQKGLCGFTADFGEHDDSEQRASSLAKVLGHENHMLRELRTEGMSPLHNIQKMKYLRT